MPYFSRLTDIVTCSLTKILAEASDPQAAIEEIIREMQEGMAGADRSARTAAANEERLKGEIAEHESKVTLWDEKAREALAESDENRARGALVRKREARALIAGLEREYEAAKALREHLMTTKSALEARLSEALRRRQELFSGAPLGEDEPAPEAAPAPAEEDPRAADIDAELEALKKELGGA
jgi:phage shock protein A